MLKKGERMICMLIKQMGKKSERVICIQDKYFDTSKVDLGDVCDINEILRRLKEYHIKGVFETCQKLNMGLKQICLILFKSNKHGLDPRFVYGSYLSYFANPKNKFEKIAVSIFKEATTIKFLEEGSEDMPYKIDFLESNINNAIMFTFTELKNKIDVGMILFKGDDNPIFDYHRDLMFINPYDYGYVPCNLRSDVGYFKVVKDKEELRKAL